MERREASAGAPPQECWCHLGICYAPTRVFSIFYVAVIVFRVAAVHRRRLPRVLKIGYNTIAAPLTEAPFLATLFTLILFCRFAHVVHFRFDEIVGALIGLNTLCQLSRLATG
jgi:hypothetical protein